MTAAKRRLTGFCTPGNGQASHARCTGTYHRGPAFDPEPCDCECHAQPTLATGRLIYDLDEATYHADPDTLSASSAKVLLGHRPPSADSEALRFGTLVHTVILEPERLGQYVVLDAHAIAGPNPKTGKPYDLPQSTAKFKAAAAEAEADGKIVTTQADWDRAHRMADAVTAHPAARDILDAATGREVSAYAEHPTGAEVRARFDLLTPSVIADIKTTRDGDPANFGKTIDSLGYHISAANYLDIAKACGLSASEFVLICVEKEPTLDSAHRVSVITLPDRAIELGRELMTEACLRWLALGRRVELPDYGTEQHVVDLPPWAYARHARAAGTTDQIPADFQWSIHEYA